MQKLVIILEVVFMHVTSYFQIEMNQSKLLPSLISIQLNPLKQEVVGIVHILSVPL